MKKYFLAAIGFLVLTCGFSDQIIPRHRVFAEAWRNAGCPDIRAFPDTRINVQEFGALGDGRSNDQPAVTAAIAALSGQSGVVYFPSGVYLIRSPIDLPSGVVLRGHSPGNTILRFDFQDHAIRIRGRETGDWIWLTESAVVHENVVAVAGEAFAAGDFAIIKQDDDPSWNISDSWAACSAGQIVKIVSADGGRLTLERPLRHDYPLKRNPQIRRINPNRHSGVENVKTERLLAGDNVGRNNRHTIYFSYAVEGWVRGVHGYKAFGSHVGIYNSSKIEVFGCFFDDAHEHDGGGSGYGVRVQTRSGECLVENNIFRRLRHSILVQAGSNGNVFGYNYSTAARSDAHPWWAGDISLHGNYPYANLFEGNIVEHIWIDNSHNGINGPYNTFFRNRAEKCGFNMSDPGADSQNVVCNELFPGRWIARIAAVFGYGFRFRGKNHFVHGNLAGSGASSKEPDCPVSYYLDTSSIMPEWWTIRESLPVIGPPHDLKTDKINPARARYLAGGEMTVDGRVANR